MKKCISAALSCLTIIMCCIFMNGCGKSESNPDAASKAQSSANSLGWEMSGTNEILSSSEAKTQSRSSSAASADSPQAAVGENRNSDVGVSIELEGSADSANSNSASQSENAEENGWLGPY